MELGLAGDVAQHDPRRPLLRGVSIILMLAAALTAAAGDVDPKEQNEDFKPRPAERKRVDIKRAKTPDTRPASNEKIDVATAPASTDRRAQSATIEKKHAPIEVSPVREPVRKLGPARITTDDKPPGKFGKKYQTPVAGKYQAGISDADPITRVKLKPEQNPAEPARINRFVLRRNEPAPATTPAGGNNAPTTGAPADAESSGP